MSPSSKPIIRKKRRREESSSPTSPTPKRKKKYPRAAPASTTPYSRKFQQHLIDHGVFPPEYRYPNGEKPAKPSNWEEINETILRPHNSLTPSTFTEDQFEEFREADAYAAKEAAVMVSVIPMIEGRPGDRRCIGGDYIFENLKPLTDGSLGYAKPDRFVGARPEQLDGDVLNELKRHVVPSSQKDLPIVPNFFLEAKGPDGSTAVAIRQACYDGAFGARGMQALLSYTYTSKEKDKDADKDKDKVGELLYDNNAYTITSIYHGGQLKLYTTHMLEPTAPGRRPEYIMTSLRSFAMTDTAETFRRGATVYRNARDWAKEKRDELIRRANERLAEGEERESGNGSGSGSEEVSDKLSASDSDMLSDGCDWVSSDGLSSEHTEREASKFAIDIRPTRLPD